MDSPQPKALPYETGFEHLRDELERTWQRVGYQIHRRWEMGTLPRSPSDGNSGIWSADNLIGLIAARNASAAVTGDQGITRVAASEEFAARTTAIDARIEARKRATMEAGFTLPLVEIARRFGLSKMQLDTLTMALMPEYDPDLLVAYRYLANDLSCRGLDVRLLSILLCDTAEERVRLASALSPLSPLILYRLIEIDFGLGGHEPSLYRRIQAAPRLVEVAAEGARDLDPLLRDAATLAPPIERGLFVEGLEQRSLEALSTPGVLLVLQGPRGSGKRMLIRNVAASLGKRVLFLNVGWLASMHSPELTQTIRGLVREARLLDALIALPNLDEVIARQERRDDLPDLIGRLCHEHPGAIALTFSGQHLPRIDLRPVLQLTLENPPLQHRGELWRRTVAGLSSEDSMTLAERFAIPGGVIEMSARAALTDTRGATVANLEQLDRAVRSQLHDRLSRLGRRLETPYTLEDLVVEQNLRDTLTDIATAISHRRRVREKWGFRGAPGVSVLFSGSPGVGKTMSATVLARELGLVVYEIDLSSVVSKWIGETEKNLEEIFSAGEPGHAILLFNEADSLFGKRTTDVRNSTDRYANLETNYLLQRLEKFSGLAILTTNLVNAIDGAFRRRFAYDVQFSFPTVEMRHELWKRAVPAQAEVGEIDYEELADRYELSGGFIKLALERSAFVAAGLGRPLTTDIVIPTIERMYLERGKLAAIGRLE